MSEERLHRYLVQNPGWQMRHKIMHWAGYPSPKDQPVTAYVMFQNDVMRLNDRLAKSGKQIVRREPYIVVGEQYQIVSIDRVAA